MSEETKAVEFSETPEIKSSITKALDLKIVQKEKLEQVKLLMNAYFSKGVTVFDFSDLPAPLRLSMVQQTPSAFVKKRLIGKTEIPYIDHFYATKCLNFIFNFDWGSEMIKSDIQVIKKAGGKTAHEAIVEMRMWGTIDGVKIERFIVSGHVMYENAATNKADALKSAVSKANTVFARQFGVGANIIDSEGKAYDSIIDVYDGVDVIKTENDAAERDLLGNKKQND